MSKIAKKIKHDTDSINFVGMNSVDVTGSCIYIVFNGKHILFECGLHQDPDYLTSYKANSEKFKFKPEDIDYIFLGHAHVDHCALLPRLYKEGCKAKIILTDVTAAFSSALLYNCSYILADEARVLSKRYKREYTPIYTSDDVDKTLDFYYEYNEYNKTYVLDDTVSFQWIENSHCPGAAQLYLTLTSPMKTKHILYTSDIGSLNTRNHYVQNTTICKLPCDYAIMESTYGDNKRKSNKTREFDLEHLRVAINTVLERKGSVIMPAFSFARTQELLTNLYEIYHNDTDFKTDIIVDSMLSCDISRLYSKVLNKDDRKLWEKVSEWDNVRFISEKEESQSSVKDHTPKIVISSSGFCTNGRILSYLQEYLRDTNSMIIFSGFVGDTPDYLSYRIKNYKDNKTISINKKPVPNRADCITLSTFSSHASHNELLEYGSNLNTNRLILVHGSKEAKECLAKELKERISKNDKTYKVRVSERDMVLIL